MKIQASKVTILLEKSHLYRWLNFFLNIIVYYLAWALVSSEITINNNTINPFFKFLLMVIFIYIHLLIIANLSQWFSIFFKDRTEIASLKNYTLILNLEEKNVFDFNHIKNIEFTTPSILFVFLWPYAKSKITITLDSHVVEIETFFKLDSLSRFFSELNSLCDEKNEQDLT